MPYISKHAPKVSTRSVNPYARESSREKRQQDTHTNTETGCPKPLFRRFEGFTFEIRSYLKLDFLHDANTSVDMEVKITVNQPRLNQSVGTDTAPS